jgi:hypothetical protein
MSLQRMLCSWCGVGALGIRLVFLRYGGIRLCGLSLGCRSDESYEPEGQTAGGVELSDIKRNASGSSLAEKY